MAELEIEGTHAEQFAIMKTAIRQHHIAINGNGQPGLLDFMSSTKGQFRLLIVMISVIGVVLAILTFLEGNRQMHGNYTHIGSTSIASNHSNDIAGGTFQ